jgi:hypothetical protein
VHTSHIKTPREKISEDLLDSPRIINSGGEYEMVRGELGCGDPSVFTDAPPKSISFAVKDPASGLPLSSILV